MATSSTFLATDGDGYELTMGRWSRKLAQPFLEFIAPGEATQVLDVGCGTGHLAGAVAARLPCARVQAIDLSATYVASARAQYPDTSLQFGVGDACALDFPDMAFDCVLSLLVLHFVPDYRRALSEMHRVTRPGGVVGAAVWDVRGGFVANRMFFDTAAALDPKAAERRAKNYTRPMTQPGELAAAWRDAGFLKVVETSIPIRMEFTSFSDYWTPYVGKEGPVAEYVGSLTAGERARLEVAVRAAYLDGDADGPRSYAALAWAVKGAVA